MASTEEYKNYVISRFDLGARITTYKMMGEYVLYFDGKVIGGIYDNRLLLKKTPSSERLLCTCSEEIPYDGAKKMLMPDIENTSLLQECAKSMYDELDFPKKRKSK